MISAIIHASTSPCVLSSPCKVLLSDSVGDVLTSADALYGHRGALLHADAPALLGIRNALGPLMPARQAQSKHEFECVACAAFDDAKLTFGRMGAKGARLRSLSLREDHFVRGPSEEKALIVHGHHILSTALLCHQKSPHLVGCIAIGPTRFAIPDILFDQALTPHHVN